MVAVVVVAAVVVVVVVVAVAVAVVVAVVVVSSRSLLANESRRERMRITYECRKSEVWRKRKHEWWEDNTYRHGLDENQHHDTHLEYALAIESTRYQYIEPKVRVYLARRRHVRIPKSSQWA